MANQRNLWDKMTTPRNPNPDIARREYMTKVALIVMSAVSTCFALIGLIGWMVQAIPLDTLGILVLMSLFFSGGWWLANRGHWRVSGYIPPVFMFLAAAYGNYIGGVDAPAMLMYALTIILVAVLQGHRLQWGALALCLIAYLGIGVAHAQGYLTQLRSAETAFANRITIASAAMIAIAALVWFLSTQYERALRQSYTLAKEAQTYAAALQEKTTELDRFFSSALDLLCIADTNGYFRRLNREWENTLGYSLEELQGHRFLDFVHPDDVAETSEAASHLTSQKEILNFTNRYRCKDGSYRWIEWRSVPYGDRIYAAARDITERKKIELALKTSQERFQGLVENLSDWIWEVNVQGAYTYVSPKVRELLGYDPQELLGKTPFDLMPPEEVERVVPALGQLMADRLPIQALENTNIHKDGHLIVFETNGTPFFDEAGNLLGYRGADRDITERKRAEEQLKESEEKFRQIVSRALVGVFRSTIEGQLVEGNPALLKILGFDSTEAINAVGLSRCYADSQERARLWELAQQGPVSGFETKIRQPNGTLVDIAISGSLVYDKKGRPLFLEGTLENITARKQVEAGLQRERQLFVGGPVVVFKWGNAEDWPVEYASPNLESSLGYRAEDLVSGAVPYTTLIHPDDLAHVIEEARMYTEEGRTSFEQEYRMVRADGAIIWIYDFTAIIRNERGEVIHYDGYLMDITERQQSQANLRTIFNAVYDAIFIHDTDGSVIDVNDKLLELYGVTREQALELSIAEDYSSPENPLDQLPILWQRVLAGEPQYFEWTARRPNDGTLFDAEVFLRKIPMGDKDVVMANVRDVSERKRAEAERARFTQRLSVAAEIATQANTILDPDELLQTVIPLIKERFGLYHVHIYTVDETAGEMRLQAGYGEPGRVMVEQGHHIALDTEKSLVARAARTQEVVVADDVRADPEFLPNPLLPDTRSEVAVPVIAGGKVLKVLDVQHDEAAYFTNADLDVFRTLAGQIATALQNAQHFKQVELSLAETETRLKVSQALAEAQTEEAVLDAMIQVAGFHPQAEVSIYTAVEGEEEKVTVRRVNAFDSGIETRMSVGSQFALSYVPLFDHVSPRKPFVSNNVAEDEAVDPASRAMAEQIGIASLGLLPLMAGRSWLGFISINSKVPDAFDDRVLYLYLNLAEQGAAGLQAARLRESLQITRTSVDQSQDAFFWFDDAGRITDVSEAAGKMLGYTREEFLTMTASGLDRSFLPETWEWLKAQIKQKGFMVVEREYSTRGDKAVPVEATLSSLQIGTEEVYFSVVRDITERKEAEAERTRFTQRLSVAAEIATQVNAILEPDKLLQTVISLIKERFGLYHVHVYTVDRAAGELRLQAGYGEPGRVMVEQGHHIALDTEKSLVARAARTQEVMVADDVQTDPEFLPHPLLPDARSEVAVPVIAGGKVLRILDIQHDEVAYFTDADLDVFRTLAGQIATALQNACLYTESQNARAFYDGIITNLPVGVWAVDQNFNPLLVNPVGQAMMGREIEDQHKEAYVEQYDIVNVNTGEHYRESDLPLVKTVTRGGKHAATDAGIRWPDGTLIPMLINSAPLMDAEGKQTGGVVIFADLTEQKKAEQAALQEKSLSDTVINSLPGIFFMHDTNRKLVRCNKVYEEVFGSSDAQSANIVAIERVPEEDRDLIHATMEKVFATSEPVNIEIHLSTKKGVKTPFSLTAQRLILDGKMYLLGIGIDITERKRAEEALEKRIVALTRPLDDVSGIAFEDLFNVADIQRLQNEFADATGVASIITHPDGTPITKPSNFCRFCIDIVRKTDKGLANCYRSDAVLGRSSAKGPSVQPCMSGGLWDAGAGISVGGKHLANWLIGQVRDETQTEEKMRAYAREIGVDEETLVEAFREVPAMSHKQFQRVAQALFTLANQLSTFAYQNIQQARFITERKQVEAKLKESEEKFRQIISRSLVGIFRTTPEGQVLEGNPVLLKITGYDSFETINRVGLSHLYADPQERTRLWELLQQGPVSGFETQYRRLDGTLVDVAISGKLMYGDNGELLYMEGILEDITERKLAQEQLKKSEEKFRQIIGRSLVGMYRSTPEGQLVECNPAMLRMMGFDSVEAVNVVGLSHCYADPQDRVRLWELAQQGPVSGFETQYRRPDGTLVDVAISGSLIHDEKGQLLFLEGTFEDITARKQVEAGLQRERELFVGGPVAVFKWVNAEGWPVEYASPNLESFIGHPAEDLISGTMPYPMLIHPDDLTRVAEEIKTHTEEGRTSFEQEYRMVRADGEVIWVYDFTAIIRNERGEATHYDGYIINITDRKRIEETLKESEVRFRTLFETMTEGVALHELIYDEEGKAVDYRIFDANPAYTKHTGVSAETVRGKRSQEIYGTDIPPYFETFSRVALTGEPLLFETYFPPLGKHFRISIISPKQGQFATVFEDITESKLRQQELEARNAEMERFTYTVSHDLRSPLITIKGFSGALEQDMATGREDRIKSDLQRIINAADKMDVLLSGLLELSRIGRVVNPSATISMDTLMREVLSLLAGPIAQRGVEVQVQPDLPTIYGDKQRMLEVMQNLIENAIKYMGEQPQPRIEIGVRDDEDEAPVFFVRDNGIGIEPRYHQTIFGLFEKLDPKAEGTGIGLALVKRIIETHEGKIWVESEGKGQGSTFCFTLPPAQ